MQSSRERLEDLVRLAIQCDLVGAERRRALLDGLPAGFVYSLPTVSRPIDQLRFDLMELQRTPRLIGLDRPPLVMWLTNAAETCATGGLADAARTFAREADAIAQTGAVARIEAVIDAQTPRPAQAPVSGAGAGSSGAYDIFLAYSGGDRVFAEKLYDALVGQHGKSVFLDVRSLVAGDPWDEVIPNALANARVTCVLVSSSLGGSWYLKDEIISAIKKIRRAGSGHRLIPLILDGADPDDLPYGLSRVHGITVNRNDTADGIAARIVAALDRRATPMGASMASNPTKPSAAPDAPAASVTVDEAVPSPAPVAEPARPLRVLFLADDPRRNDRAALTIQAKRIEDAIRSGQALHAISILPRFAMKYQDLVDAIDETSPDIVHFAGMGHADGILFADENSGEYVAIPARGLARVFGLAHRPIRGVVVNTSHSSHFAGELVSRVDFAIGMSGAVTETAALDFAGALYGAIARGKSVAKAVETGEVMMQMRSTIDDAAPVLHLGEGISADDLILRVRSDRSP